MASRTPFRSTFTPLALGVLVVGALLVTTLGPGRDTARDGYPAPPGPSNAPGSQDLTPGEDPDPIPSQPESKGNLSSGSDVTRTVAIGTGREDVLQAQEACVDVGYLCAPLATEGTLQLIRWPQNTRRILVLVPEPEGVPDQLAGQLQRAAVRGIQTWHNHPIPLLVRTRADTDTPQIQVQWARKVEEGRLGRAGVRWRGQGGQVRFQVEEFLLATHDPQTLDRILDPTLVELVAAHEMGHALGLPHSDDPRDVMFPENTATRLTVRDFRTVEALYRLPNGAVIQR